ncbi:unnamed protein product [Pleuronectes platessa]|uniref:CCHC-type domain-containing protein n=1 Tax=Pleuronectes platessa TaxID=8262 RepID=A0A9N7YIS7_PLEPL|nr:unnamed protein product [Pleuronectes platessa]
MDLADVECYTCGKKGHMARICPDEYQVRRGGGLVAETWTMGREGLWFVSGSTPRRDNKRRTWIDLSKNPRVSLPCLVPLSKAPYSPNICSPSAVNSRSLLCVSCTRWVKSRD